MSKTAGNALTRPSADPPPPPTRWQGSDLPGLPGSLGTAIGAGLSSLEDLLAEARGMM